MNNGLPLKLHESNNEMELTMTNGRYYVNVNFHIYILISSCDNFRCLSKSERKGRLMSRFLIIYGIKMAKQMRQTPIKLIIIPASASS